MKQRYYFSYRSDNYMAVMAFTNKYAAKTFTQKRRDIEQHGMTWDTYSKVMSRQEAIANTSNNNLYTNWRDAARECLPGFT